MAKYELTEAKLYFKKQLEDKGYKFIEKDGEKPVIVAEPFSKDDIELFGLTPKKKQKILDNFKNSSFPYFVDTNGIIITNWNGYI